MKQPTFLPANLSALRQSLIKQNKLQSLENDEAIPVIPSGSQPLDWVTDCAGIPRGRVVQFRGPESSGKCVALKTFVPVFRQGLVRMEDLCRQVDWDLDREGQVEGDQHQSIAVQVPGSNGEPVNATHLYYAGHLPTCKVITEDGHELVGARDHRVLCLMPNGLASFTMLRDLRIGSVVIKTVGQRVTGPREEVWGWDLPTDDREITLREASTAALLGALCGVEFRDGCYYLMVSHPHQIRLVRQWAQDLTGDPEMDPFDGTVTDFARFSGMARIRAGSWSELARKGLEAVPEVIRQSSLTAQAHWCAGLTLVRGAWTRNDLEIEIQNPDVAQTLHLLMENIGIRCLIYPCLNTFASEMTKVAIRDRLAEQAAQDLIWKGYSLPPDWKGCSVREDVETHAYAAETLIKAREILIREGHKDLAHKIDPDDLDKENLGATAEILHPLARRTKTANRIFESVILLSSPNVYLDRVALAKPSASHEILPLVDLSVPIGAHYSTNSLVSHNSTLALHYARNELDTNPKAVVVYQDYEHSMTVKYARQILKRNFDRFFLIPSDAFEEVDKMLGVFFRTHGISPALWIIDSVPAMVPQETFGKFASSDDDDDEDGKKKKGTRIGLQAALFAEALARWVKIAGGYGTTFLLLNQIRADIKISPYQKTDGSDRGMVPGEKSPGGYALRFYNSMTLDLKPITLLKAKRFNPLISDMEEIPVANSVKIMVTKNKCGAPKRSCMIYIEYGEGVDDTRTLFDLAFNRQLINKEGKGSVYSLEMEDGLLLSVNGRENFIDALKGKNSGNLGPLAVEHLKKLLKWDRIDEIHSQVIGLSVEDVESGETTSLESEDDSGEVDPGMLAFIRSLKTFGEKADALEILRWDKKIAVWVNPETQEEFRARSVAKFLDKIGDEAAQKVFIRVVQEKIADLERRAAAPMDQPPLEVNAEVTVGGLLPPSVEESEATLDELLTPRAVETTADLGGEPSPGEWDESGSESVPVEYVDEPHPDGDFDVDQVAADNLPP